MTRVIFIDDHKIITDGLESLLRDVANVSVVGIFQVPQDAIDFLDKNQVDLVFTDQDMPGFRGEDILAYCKSKFPRTKVIFLTMYNEKALIQHLIKLGADGYLVKSSGKETILNAIETVMHGGKYFSDEVIRSLVAEPAMNVPRLVDETLSKREIQIIKLIAEGNSSKEIGNSLNISQRTVETHRRNIQKKLNTNGIAGIIRYAFHHNLIS